MEDEIYAREMRALEQDMRDRAIHDKKAHERPRDHGRKQPKLDRHREEDLDAYPELPRGVKSSG